MVGTHAAVHVTKQSDSGSSKPEILPLSQNSFIAIFLQLMHDQTRTTKNRRFFSHCVVLPSLSPRKGACPYLIWLSFPLLTRPIVVWGAETGAWLRPCLFCLPLTGLKP